MVELRDSESGDIEDTEKTDTLALIFKEIQRLRGGIGDSLDDLRKQVKELNERVHRIETHVKLIQHEQQTTGVCLAEMKYHCARNFHVCADNEKGP